jgi:hypothetical protein
MQKESKKRGFHPRSQLSCIIELARRQESPLKISGSVSVCVCLVFLLLDQRANQVFQTIPTSTRVWNSAPQPQASDQSFARLVAILNAVAGNRDRDFAFSRALLPCRTTGSVMELVSLSNSITKTPNFSVCICTIKKPLLYKEVSQEEKRFYVVMMMLLLLSTSNLIFKENANDWVAIDLFVHHQSKDSHHGSSAIVQFDGALSQFLYRKEEEDAKNEVVRERDSHPRQH